jgi:hypothetical protein
MTRRLLLLGGSALTAVGALAFGGPRVVLACDQNSCIPQLVSVTPAQVVLNGKPLHLTLAGADLSGVTSVIISPVVAGNSFTVYNDSTILMTLPAATGPGFYSVRVVSSEGSSDPSTPPQFQVAPAAPPSQAPTPRPKPTPTPRPTPTPTPPMPETGIVVVGQHGAPPPPPALVQSGGGQVSPTSAPVDILAGLALGALLYLLWGNPRRLAGSWRSDPLLHLLGRPAQALHLGRICLYCGRLHYVWATRRDLWHAGRYCGAKCFLSAEAMPSPLAEEDEPEPVATRKKQAWWRAAVATAEAGAATDPAAPGGCGQPGWRPRY